MISTQSTFDQPRGIVEFDNEIIEFIDILIFANGNYNANNWRVTIPISGLTTAQLQYFANSPTITAKIYIGYPKNPENYNVGDLTFMVEGICDKPVFDWLLDTIELTGRDYSALFINSMIDPTLYSQVNATPSQIVQQIVESKKLKYVIAPVSQPFGKFYFNNYFTQPTIKTDWDLLTIIAQTLNYSLYVRGDTVYFQPKPTAATYQVKYSRGAVNSSTTITLQTTRMMSLSKSVIVTVNSYNQAAKTTYVGVAQRPAIDGSTTLGRDPIHYYFSIPNLSLAQANMQAQTLLDNILIHGMSLSFSVPDIVTREDVVQMQGTNTLFDQIYYPFNVRHELSVTSGLLTTVLCRNYPAQTRASE